MLVIVDSNVNLEPSAEEVGAAARLAAGEVRLVGLVPKIALRSHSNFGTSSAPSARKMREAVRRLQEMLPDIEIEGEMKADAALSEAIRGKLMPDSKLNGVANLLVMPNHDAANIRSEDRRVGKEYVLTCKSR